MDNDNSDTLTEIAELKLKVLSIENEKEEMQSTFNTQIKTMEDTVKTKDSIINSLEEKLASKTSIESNTQKESETQNKINQMTNKKIELESALSQYEEKMELTQKLHKEENEALVNKIDFFQQQVLKLNQEKKKLKEFFEKNIINILKEKNEQISDIKKQNDEMKLSFQQRSEVSVNKEKEIRQTVKLEYEKEKSLLKEEITRLKTEPPKSVKLPLTPKENKLSSSLVKTRRFSFNENDVKEDYMLDRSISLSFYPEEDNENYIENKDHNEEIKSIKEYYENIVNELKIKIIQLEKGDKKNNQNDIKNKGIHTDIGQSYNENEELINDLVKQIIQLKDNLAEMAFVKDSRIIQLKKQNTRLVNFFNAKFKPIKQES